MLKSDKARMLIRSGKPWTPNTIAEQIDGHVTIAYKLRRDDEVLGFRYVQDATGAWRCVNPDYEPGDADYDRLRAQHRAAAGLPPLPAAQRTPLKKAGPETLDRPEPTYAERERLAATARVQARQEQAEHARTAAANGHTLALMADPGASMLGVPLQASLALQGAAEGNGDGMLGTPLPFGANVQVFAMVLKEDGSLRFGIQSGDRRWIADVVGEVPR